MKEIQHSESPRTGESNSTYHLVMHPPSVSCPIISYYSPLARIQLIFLPLLTYPGCLAMRGNFAGHAFDGSVAVCKCQECRSGKERSELTSALGFAAFHAASIFPLNFMPL
jgi:hypothetical protein